MSLGHSSKELRVRYALSSGLFQLMCFIIASGLSFGAIPAVNAILKSPDVLNISYGILRVEPLSLLICVGVAILSAFITTAGSIKRLSKIDIANTMRGNH